jgi:hypothetical protein
VCETINVIAQEITKDTIVQAFFIKESLHFRPDQDYVSSAQLAEKNLL